MWQHHYQIHAMRMDALRAEAERERRWRQEDLANGRSDAQRSPSRGRAQAARAIAAISRGAARAARRLDERITIDPGPERTVREA
jgi:hypothetical protein